MELTQIKTRLSKSEILILASYLMQDERSKEFKSYNKKAIREMASIFWSDVFAEVRNEDKENFDNITKA